MEPVNILGIASREELRRWYEENHAAAREFWLPVNRLDSVQRHEELFENRLEHLIEQCAKGKMFGQWNDGGRLLTHKDKED